MADTKISALTASTTPLAGTEVLPIVQSGTTKQVSVANLTAGRAMSATSIALNGAAAAPTPAFIRNGSFSCSPFGADKQMATFGAYNDDLTNGGFVLRALITDVPTEIARGGLAGLTVTSGNLVIGTSGKGIDFSATPGTGTSELLSDYEEGDWTPADGSGAGLVFTVNYAKYTKVGRQVSYIANISYPVTADATGASIQGFPFAAGNAIFGNVNYTTEPAATLLYFAGNTTSLFLLTPGNNTTNAQMSGEALIFSGTYFI
jgi:hypothetical protein